MFRIMDPRRDHSRLKVNLNRRRMSTVSSYRTLAGVISFEPSLFSFCSRYSIAAIVHPCRRLPNEFATRRVSSQGHRPDLNNPFLRALSVFQD